MKPQIAVFAACMVVATAALAADSTVPARSSNAATAFAQLKSLVGEWEANTDMGKIHLSLELASGGNVVLEHMKVEALHENMVTAYYLDGDQFALTHYCELGNNPRMIARKIDLEHGEVDFDFAGAANLPSEQSQHMHSAVFRFGDADHFSSSWTMFENGKPKMTVVAQYSRSN